MSNYKLLILAFLEGFSVMLIELLGGKMLIPYFGNSLIIWTSTIGVTMSSLMLGYFLGGKLSSSSRSFVFAFVSVSAVAFWISFMPSLAYKSLSFTQDLSLYNASVISAIILLSIPLILLGSCPPIFISLMQKENTGMSSGKVFGVSTVGGIFAALFSGFYVLPKFGVSLPLIFFSIMLVLSSIIIFWSAIKEKTYFILALLPITFGALIYYKSNRNVQQIYLSESLQGQLKVEDVGFSDGYVRSLFINGVAQTKSKLYQNAYHNESLWWYVHLDGAVASSKPAKSNVLLMGFGGGSIAQELIKLDFNIDVVEIDERLPGISHDYFFTDTSKVNFYIDDARHFIKQQQGVASEKYDLIILDLLHGEVQPNHVFTVEGLLELKKLAKPDALILVNYQSNYDEPKQPVLAILKTFLEAGFEAKVTPQKRSKPDDYIFIASPTSIPNNLFVDERMNDCCFNNREVNIFRKYAGFISIEQFPKFNEPLVLKDNYPVLELLNKESVEEWRKHMIEPMNNTPNATIFK